MSDTAHFRESIIPVLTELVINIEHQANERTANWLGERAARLRQEAHEAPNTERFSRYHTMNMQAQALEQAAFDMLAGRKP